MLQGVRTKEIVQGEKERRRKPLSNIVEMEDGLDFAQGPQGQGRG
jgi:hypothetical protein